MPSKLLCVALHSAFPQDVAQASAGKLLGLTNSCSIALGIVGNLCTGMLVESTGSYSVVFMVRLDEVIWACHLNGLRMERHRGQSVYGQMLVEHWELLKNVQKLLVRANRRRTRVPWIHRRA